MAKKLVEQVIVQEVGNSCCRVIRAMVTLKSWRRYLKEASAYQDIEVVKVLKSCGHRHNIHSRGVYGCIEKI